MFNTHSYLVQNRRSNRMCKINTANFMIILMITGSFSCLGNKIGVINKLDKQLVVCQFVVLSKMIILCGQKVLYCRTESF